MTTPFSPSRLVVLSPRRPLASSAKVAALLLTVGGSLALAGTASAQVFKVTATGKITSFYNQRVPYNSSVAVGTPFTFTYLFDYSAPLVLSSPGDHAYSLTGANAGATSTFGDYKFTPQSTSVNSVYVYNNGGNSNRIDLTSGGETTPGFSVPYYAATSYIQITDSQGLFSSSSLPPLSAYSAIPVSDIHFVANVQDIDGYVSGIAGSVTSLSAELVNPAAVPEASTWVSLGVMLGLGGLGLAVRRRRVMGEGTEGTWG